MDDIDKAEEANRDALKQAASLFSLHMETLHRLIGYKERAAASLFWGSMKTVFKGLPVYDDALDVLLPLIKALPTGAPKEGAAAPKAASRGRPKS